MVKGIFRDVGDILGFGEFLENYGFRVKEQGLRNFLRLLIRRKLRK